MADLRRNARLRRSRRSLPPTAGCGHLDRRTGEGGWWGTLPAGLAAAAHRNATPRARLRSPSRSSTATRGSIPFHFLAVCVERVPRRIARAPSVAAGDAGSADVGDVEQLGRDQPGHRRAPRHRARRRRRDRLAHGTAADGSDDFTGHRARPRRDAGWARGIRRSRGTRAAGARTPLHCSRRSAEATTGALRVGGDARARLARWRSGRAADSVRRRHARAGDAYGIHSTVRPKSRMATSERDREVRLKDDTMPRWGMAADLDRCTGCGACVTACHAENNISTVGAEQAARGRAKHWIRVERYWEGEFPDVRLKFRPVMCQQCDNAPCEPVCPTYASHHTDGRPQRAGLQPLHRHALLRQRVSLQRAVLRLLQPVLGQAAAPAAQSRRLAARSRRDGEVHLLRAAHQGRDDPGEGRRSRR